MSKNWHPPYSGEFKARVVELVRGGRTPAELTEECEPSSASIRQWATGELTLFRSGAARETESIHEKRSDS